MKALFFISLVIILITLLCFYIRKQMIINKRISKQNKESRQKNVQLKCIELINRSRNVNTVAELKMLRDHGYKYFEVSDFENRNNDAFFKELRDFFTEKISFINKKESELKQYKN